MLPAPLDAKVSWSGLALASAMSSLMFFTGNEGCTTTRNGPCDNWITGVMSLIGSKLSLKRLGFTA